VGRNTISHPASAPFSSNTFGVEVVVLVPADPERHVREARQNPNRKALFDHVETLGEYKNFALVGIAVQDAQKQRQNIYLHAKIMFVDDVWATIGSCNLHSNSFSGHSEMNVSFWDLKVVRRLCCQLSAEHLNQDTAGMDDRAALRLAIASSLNYAVRSPRSGRPFHRRANSSADASASGYGGDVDIPPSPADKHLIRAPTPRPDSVSLG
jgi:phosphatidylserine/phosphatidylglycerophosphate/cardiolipin synthase-like enzyme